MENISSNNHIHLNSDWIEQLKLLELKAKTIVEGFISGLHQSPFKGFSIEFAEHQIYTQGDSFKDIDWKVFARTDKLYIKKYQEKTNMACYILFDNSSSMAFGSKDISKSEYAKKLIAALAYLMVLQRDQVGLMTFGEETHSFIQAKSTYHHLHILLSHLIHVMPKGKTNISQTLHIMANRLKRRSMIILISDLFDDPSNILKGLSHLKFKKHDVIVLHVLDPAEKILPYKEPYVFIDSESGESVQTSPAEIQKKYKKTVKKWIQSYIRECSKLNIDYDVFSSQVPAQNALSMYLNKRKHMKQP